MWVELLPPIAVKEMSSLLFFSTLVAALLGASMGAYTRTVSYEGEVVAKCSFTDAARRDSFLGLDEDLYMDVWRFGADGSIDVRMVGRDFARVQRRFPECLVAIDDVERFVAEAELRDALQSRVNASWDEEYHEYKDIVDWYSKLAMNNPDVVEFVSSIGKSVEGRDMPAIHIKSRDVTKESWKMYFQCQIHAREWISGATCMYLANYLVVNYNTPTVKSLVDTFEVIFVPFVNPDGYAYTWAGDRLWRKNRRVSSPSCRGVDLNRNYNVHWGGSGSSSNPCSETYHGSSVASEPETQNTVKYFKDNAPIIGAIDWHSYSQLILRPNGWTTALCPDEAEFKEFGDEMARAIEKVHGMHYTSQRSVQLYPTTGSASDWFYDKEATDANKGYRAAGLTIELRDTGRYGFELPANQIVPTGEEVLEAVFVYADALRAKPMKP